MHFIIESKAVQGENGPKTSDHNWVSTKFTGNFELVYQFSLTAIRQRPAPKIWSILLSFYISDFVV